MRNLLLITSAFLLLFITGCQSIMKNVPIAGTAVSKVTGGTISAQHVDSAVKTSRSVGKAMQDITPEQEYYIGRSIGAIILKTYKPYNKPTVNAYINKLGQILAAASDKPETFNGYHFLVLDTDEINAFAAPGGLIFVSRGLIKCCKTEDALAAVLAHEVAHVQHSHGLSAIKKSRWTGAVKTMVAEGAKSYGPQQLASLTQAFEGALSDITQTLVNSGYARKFESQADKSAVKIMKRVGYNPTALKDMLIQMNKVSKPGKGFGKTHPDPMDRVKDIESLIDDSGEVSQPKARKTRFAKALSSL